MARKKLIDESEKTAGGSRGKSPPLGSFSSSLSSSTSCSDSLGSPPPPPPPSSPPLPRSLSTNSSGVSDCWIGDWSCEDLSLWLEDKGFGSLIPVMIEDHKLDGVGILSLTQSDCINVLGIQRLGDVKRLLFAIESHVKVNEPSWNPPHEKSGEFTDNEVPHCRNCRSVRSVYAQTASPERLKALFAFLYVLVVSWMTAFVMVIVHDRVPDMNKYPPLPDIILDNLPHIPWAFEMCEFTGMVLLALWILVIIFHKHRFILMRRFFSIGGTIFLLRCVTMLITSLSVPGKHLDCAPRPYGDIWNKYYNAYQIWSGAGLTVQGVRTCGDYMFSGHTVGLTLLNFFITEYTTTKIYFLHTFTWICNVFGIFFILAAHEHYSIDVFVAFYISSRLFMYYHTLANNRAYNRESKDEENRTWFWFPLFSYFETGIDGKIPNEFGWPITLREICKIINNINFNTMKIFGHKESKIEITTEVITEVPKKNGKINNNYQINKYIAKRKKKQN